MFKGLTLRGVNGTVMLRPYGHAATLRTWVITRSDTQWQLSGVIERADPFVLRQRGLAFTAPRKHLRGFWFWPVEPASVQIQGARLVARLGPPENGG